MAPAIFSHGLPFAYAMEVKLAWEKPDKNADIIDGYKIYYIKDYEDLDNAEVIEIPADKTSWTISGLEKESVYFFTAVSFKKFYSEPDGCEVIIESTFSETIKYPEQKKYRDNGGCFIKIVSNL